YVRFPPLNKFCQESKAEPYVPPIRLLQKRETFPYMPYPDLHFSPPVSPLPVRPDTPQTREYFPGDFLPPAAQALPYSVWFSFSAASMPLLPVQSIQVYVPTYSHLDLHYLSSHVPGS